MNLLLRRLAIALGGVVGMAIVAGAVLYVLGGSRLGARYDITTDPVEVPSDSASIARGRHLAESVMLCHGCHGDDLGGGVLVDEPLMATIHASNLTAGRGGVGRAYSDADYVRAIRHGVNPEGRALMIMHSDAYHGLGRSDLGALLAHVRSMPPVDRDVPRTATGVLGRILVALGQFDREQMPLLAAEVIDHGAPLTDAPEPAVTPEYGAYLVSLALCRMCHGDTLRGGLPLDEGAPPGPDITVYGREDGWSAEQFVTTIRTGVTPYDRALDPEYMPWEAYRGMTDDELLAIRSYLASIAR